MDSIEQADAHETKELAEHVETHASKRLGALWISLLALFLALNSVGGGKVTKEMLTSVIQASDSFNFYQAKSIKGTAVQLAADQLSVLAANPSWPDSVKSDINAKIETYRQTIARYESDPKTGEGKQELLEKGKHFQDEFREASARDPYFEYAGALLQIAIVVASAGLALGIRPLFGVSVAVGTLGMLLVIDAFALVVRLPFP